VTETDSNLLALYEATTFRVETPNGPIDIRIGQTHPALDKFVVGNDVTTWAYVTAWNPASAPLSQATNDRRHFELIDLVHARRWAYFEGDGVPDNPGWAPERSVWIARISRDDAAELGRRFGQKAIVVGSVEGPAELMFL
jgi:hypothetical protein